MKQQTPSVTVWFDGACPLCTHEIGLMRKLDRRGAIAFIDVLSAQSCPIDRRALLARFHAKERDREIVSGAAAFAAMWRAIPILSPLGHALRWPPALWAMEKAYLGWLKVRPWLQRRLAGSLR
jgi:predicted DCC family thiol-disulfide oxidoreductase YuxK